MRSRKLRHYCAVWRVPELPENRGCAVDSADAVVQLASRLVTRTTRAGIRQNEQHFGEQPLCRVTVNRARDPSRGDPHGRICCR